MHKRWLMRGEVEAPGGKAEGEAWVVFASDDRAEVEAMAARLVAKGWSITIDDRG